MDGLVILGAGGRPIVLSRFRQQSPVYPLMHADYVVHAIAGARGTRTGAAGERDLAPVLSVPIDGDERHAGGSDEEGDLGDGEESDMEGGDAETENGVDGVDGVGAGEWAAGSVRAPAEENVWTTNRTDERTTPTDRDAEESLGPAAPHLLRFDGGSVLCHIKVGELRLLCPVSRDVDPLLPFEFLRKVVDVLQVYLVGSTDPALLTEELICDHFDVVYQLLEEMLDGEGNVLLTEVNTLKDIVLPPSWLDKLVQTVGLGSAPERTRTTLSSPVPWRRPNSKYPRNEVYFDVIESLDGIVARDGHPVTLDLYGRIRCNAKLSGVPELTVLLSDPSLVDDAAWHPCVRQHAWASARKLNFVPPDGEFELGEFRLRSSLAADASSLPGRPRGRRADATLPVSLQVHLGEKDAGAPRAVPFSITVAPCLSASQALEDVVVEWNLGDGAQGVDASAHEIDTAPHSTGLGSASWAPDVGVAQAPTNGSMVFDRQSRLLRWTIEKLPAIRKSVLKGSLLMGAGPCRPLYALQVRFAVAGESRSGLRITSIHLDKQPYVPVKGVRMMLHGALEWRR
ncbi:hypothetical protein MSPP1_002903 [Malassezia sp. CBS 17886]|nr:hypothetical protein MSPP1_002903 [Malassezia sp. CBS 17886]